MFLLLLSTNVFAPYTDKNGDTKYRVFTDGIYDLTHLGHFRAIQKARKVAAAHLNISDDQIFLIVGISGLSEKQRTSYKRQPVLTREEIKNTLQLVRGVDRVIYSPLKTTSGVMRKQNYDLVVAGDDYAVSPYGLRNNSGRKGMKYYPGAIESGQFTTFPREPNISTTELMRRTTTRMASYIQDKLVKEGKEEKCIQVFLDLMDQHFPAPIPPPKSAPVT